jgi:hypothetical protein
LIFKAFRIANQKVRSRYLGYQPTFETTKSSFHHGALAVMVIVCGPKLAFVLNHWGVAGVAHWARPRPRLILPRMEPVR